MVIWGIRFIDDRIVVVGRADQVLAHGTTGWLCQTHPPMKSLHEVVSYRLEAAHWLKDNAGAEEVIEGIAISFDDTETSKS